MVGLIIVLAIVLPVVGIWSLIKDNTSGDPFDGPFDENFLNSAGRDGWDEHLD